MAIEIKDLSVRVRPSQEPRLTRVALADELSRRIVAGLGGRVSLGQAALLAANIAARLQATLQATRGRRP
jgi:hypothetical protein